MAHISLKSDDCRIFIKNGVLRFQALRYDSQGAILDQVTVNLPLDMTHKFAFVENFDEKDQTDPKSSRIKGFIRDDEKN